MRRLTTTSRRTLRALSAILLAVGLSVWGGLGLRQVGRGTAPPGAAADAVGRSHPLAGAAFANGAGDSLLTSVANLQGHLRDRPDDSVGWASLGMDYIQQAKAAGDPTYYAKAEGVLSRSLALSSQDNFVAMAGMGALESARHNFTEALSWAQRAAAIDPYNSTIQGILGDAYTQLGLYPQAYQAIQRMVDLEPGTPSLARASYAWELRGNLSEATKDMQRALTDATTPADRAFTRYYLAELAFNAGDPDAALAQDLAGLRDVPGDATLLEGKAKAEAALGETAAALGDYRRAVSLVPQPQYVIELGELYQSLGDMGNARQQYDLFRAEEQLLAGNGVTLDTDPTLFDADHGDPAEALKRGEAGIKSRPFVEMEDAYAWALHKNGRNEEALAFARKATGVGTRNALFFFHRGMIEADLGHRDSARADLAEALRINPHFNPLQAPVARAVLTRLEVKP
jgi:tetratricopeptide (TPR) repeat protein